MKKITAILLTAAMVLSLAACSGGGSSQTTAAPEPTTEAITFGEEVGTEVWVNDGNTMITDAAFDEYFTNGAEAGVVALMDAGLVYVNGVKLPVDENAMTEYQVNGVRSLYKTDSGWGFNVHKTTSADNLSFADARLGFIQTISQVRGHETTLGLDADGNCVRIDVQSFDVARVKSITVYNESTTIDRGEFELETNRIRPDVNEIVFNSKYFDQELVIGDIAIYWYDAEGWKIIKATPVEGTLAKNENNEFVINGTDARIESNVSRYNLINSNRPTQFFTSYNRLGLTDVSVITWCTPTGHPIGFTYGSGAKEVLARAIKFAEELRDSVTVSEDGSGLESGTVWASQAAVDEFNEAIDAAKADLNNNLTSLVGFDYAIYELSNAVGEAGDNPSGFVGAQGTVE